MAETDIFNPTNWTAAGLTFNPNPSYGFTRKMGSNRQIARPRMGIYPERDVMNGGHVFSLMWVGTDLSTMQRINSFYHAFKAGYFTLIDQDNEGRHYVGRFMTEPEPSHPANGKYTLQGVVFEEMPRARMLQYPSNFVIDGHTINVVDDYLKPRVAMMQGAWTIQLSPTAPAGSTPQQPALLEAFDAIAAIGDWAQVEYVGFGFFMVFRLDPSLGTVNIFLDGNLIVQSLDLASGNNALLAGGLGASCIPTSSYGGVVGTSGGAAIDVILTVPNVSLDVHRVKVQAVGPNSSAASGSPYAIIFPQLTYIY